MASNECMDELLMCHTSSSFRGVGNSNRREQYVMVAMEDTFFPAVKAEVFLTRAGS